MVFHELSSVAILLLILAILSLMFLGVIYYTGGTLISPTNELGRKIPQSVFSEYGFGNIEQTTPEPIMKELTLSQVSLNFGKYTILISQPSVNSLLGEILVVVSVSDGSVSRTISNFDIMSNNVLFIVETNSTFLLTTELPSDYTNYYVIKFVIYSDALSYNPLQIVKSPYGYVEVK